MSSDPQFLLHTYFRSSCSGRLRIALNFKQISYESEYIHLVKGEQLSEEYKAINPSCSVPYLQRRDTDTSFGIGQSVAALEYLEEAFPDKRPLLPKEPLERAKVRTLVNIIACDVQPVTNLRIIKAVGKLGVEAKGWQQEWVGKGFTAYEETCKRTAGKYSVGDEVTLADVCLLPAVWGAERFEVDMAQFPTLNRIYETLMEEDAVKKAHWKVQPDTPEELR